MIVYSGGVKDAGLGLVVVMSINLRRRPIFPERHHSSIVGAGAFHFRVRDGNGWGHTARATEGWINYIVIDADNQPVPD